MRNLIIALAASCALSGCGTSSAEPSNEAYESLTTEDVVANDLEMAAEMAADNAIAAADAAVAAAGVTVDAAQPVDAPKARVPAFNSNAYCRQVAAVGGGGSYMMEESCRSMEAEARSSIASMRIPNRVYSYCKQVAEVSGAGSYTMFKSCAEMELGAASRL